MNKQDFRVIHKKLLPKSSLDYFACFWFDLWHHRDHMNRTGPHWPCCCLAKMHYFRKHLTKLQFYPQTLNITLLLHCHHKYFFASQTNTATVHDITKIASWKGTKHSKWVICTLSGTGFLNTLFQLYPQTRFQRTTVRNYCGLIQNSIGLTQRNEEPFKTPGCSWSKVKINLFWILVASFKWHIQLEKKMNSKFAFTSNAKLTPCTTATVTFIFKSWR